MPEKYDVMIVGGGAAALSAAIYAGRAKLRTAIFEKKYPGGQIMITDEIANYPGFPDDITGPELVQRMEQQARKFDTDIRFEEVKELKVENGAKIVVTDQASYNAPIVILAMGADPRKLNVPGEEEFLGKGVSYCATCDGPFFKDKKVVVVGGGDAAITEAIFLTKFATEVLVIHRRDELRAQKLLADQAMENPKIHFLWNSAIEEIVGRKSVEAVKVKNVETAEVQTLPCEGVFIFIGNIPNTGFLGDLLKTDSGGHIPTNIHTETEVDGIYAIGDVRQFSYRQIATAVGEGATAAIAAEHKILFGEAHDAT